MCMSVSRVSVFLFSSCDFYFDVWVFHHSLPWHFDAANRDGVYFLFECDDTPVWMAVMTFAFGFATTPLVLLCLGRGGFCFRLGARYVCACALIGLHFPNFTTAQYLFQYMISFFLRSRYSFIFKGTKSLFICGYVPLCSIRRVLWVLLMLLGDGLLPAHCAVLAHLA